MARNQGLNEKMKEERREKILSLAVEVFAAKGLSGTKISDIAKASGMSLGLVYHYYKSKEEVYVEVVEIAMSKMLEASQSLQKMDVEPSAKIEMAIDGLIEGVVNTKEHVLNHLLVNQAMTMENTPETLRQSVLFKKQEVYRIFNEIFKEGINQGQFARKSPNDFTTLLWSLVKGLALNKASFGNDFVCPETEIIKSMFLIR